MPALTLIPTNKGRLLAVSAAVLFSTGGPALKSSAFTAIQMSGLRSGVAAIALLVFLRGRRQFFPRLFGPAVLYAATVTLFVMATKLTSAASAIFLQSLAPLLILPLAPLVGDRFRIRDVPFLGCLVAGLWLCVSGRGAPSVTAPDPATGNLLALACAITWALTLLSLRALEHEPDRRGTGLQVVAAGNVLAALVALPFAWPLPSATIVDWATVVYLGVVQIGLAYWCLTSAVRYVPAFEVSILLLVEPVLNPLWTWLVRGEEPGASVIAGGIVIIGATAVRTLLALKNP
jgi:drug/metabolite transporter, DME family